MSESPAPLARVRSFVMRAGRLTAGQARALEELWPQMGLEFTPAVLDLDQVFGRSAPRTMEIGFGNGEPLVQLAKEHPERDYLGIEVHAPGVGHCLLRAATLELTNLRISRHDAVEVLQRQIAPDALDEVLIYFADPWPKKRHHKRRLIQPAFVELLASRLQPGGLLRLATDWRAYAEHMLAVLNASLSFENLSPTGDYVPRPAQRPVTRFEKRGERLGHEVYDLMFKRR